MKRETLLNKIKSIPNGRFFRIRYMTQMKVAAEYQQQGISIVKITETTTRTGVQYNHIKGVISTYPESYVPKKPTGWEWVIKNKIKYNTNTKSEYLVIAPLQTKKQANTKIHYVIIYGGDGKSIIIHNDNRKTIDEYLIPSQRTDYVSQHTNTNKGGKVINIQLNNILYIS